VTPEAWALLSACCFAGSHVASKRGLQDTSVTAASLIVLAVSWLVIALSVAVDPPSSVTGKAILVYSGLGLIVPAISRWAVLMSVDALGPSIAIPLQQGLRPLLSVGGAVLFLGERLDLIRGIGVAAIIFGGWQLSRRPREERGPSRGGPISVTDGGVSRWALRAGITYPIVAAVAYSASDLLIRATISDDLAEPGFAAMIGTGSGLTAWLLVVGAVPSVRSSVRAGRRAWWLVLAGVLIGGAILSVYNALRLGEVTLVTPINSTQPLLVVLLSALLLRDLERIRFSTLVSAVAIVAGAILVSL
jgi:drug/metabolite transporter (DMT)-like permease